ncbi:MAG TPA: YceI family protein, partial [Flavisolibacter sp.]|nr:YceI family protein [Flavisolibacter sp.]
MFKNLSIFLFLVFFAHISQAQSKFYTKSGKIEFYSNATMEDIDAKTKTALALLDAKTGNIQLSVLLKSFEFEKAL